MYLIINTRNQLILNIRRRRLKGFQALNLYIEKVNSIKLYSRLPVNDIFLVNVFKY